MHATLDQLLDATLRIVIIESFAADKFGLTVSIGYNNVTVFSDHETVYWRASIQEIMHDLSLHTLGEIFIHQKQDLPFLDIPAYLTPTDFGNGVIHLTPNILMNPAESLQFINTSGHQH